MIRLIGVITEGGVPVVIKSYVKTEGEMVIGALISAAKTLCDAMGSGEVRKLAFKEHTLIVTESKKCYTVVALVEKAEDYMDTLLRIIAEEIDDSDIPQADGTATDLHFSIVENILETYIKETLDVSLSKIVSFAWTPILETIGRDQRLSPMIDVLEKRLDSADLRASWKGLKEKTPTSLDRAVEFALRGEYDRACAASIDLNDDLARIFAIKMAHLARSVSSTTAPSLERLKQVSMMIMGNDIYCKLARSIVSFLAGEITSSEYTSAFRQAAQNFDFNGHEAAIIYTYLFMDIRVSTMPDFATHLANYLRDRSPILHAYIFSILDRDAIFDKLYSVSSYDDFKDTIGFYKGRIDSILEPIQKVLKKGLVKRLRKTKGVQGISLQASLQLQNYITLLTALAESPILTISERKNILAEVLDLYWRYFRRLLREEMPIFSHTIDSVFQSLGVACAEYYYLTTGTEREKHLKRIGEFLKDIIDTTGQEWAKNSMRFPIFVVTNVLGTALTRAGAFLEETVILLYLAMKSTDIDALEELRESAPVAYATNTGNILTSLASVSYNLLSEDIRLAIFSECVLRSLKVQQWFVSQGIICRDDIISVTYHATYAAEMLSKDALQRVVKVVTALNRIAVQDPRKYDYEVAMTGSSLIGILVKGWEQLGNPHYFEQASSLLNYAATGWRKYGFYEKADNLEKRYSSLKL